MRQHPTSHIGKWSSTDVFENKYKSLCFIEVEGIDYFDKYATTVISLSMVFILSDFKKNLVMHLLANDESNKCTSHATLLEYFKKMIFPDN